MGHNILFKLLERPAVLLPSENNESQLFKMIMICLALTWLNPHVYLDTVVLIGSISTKFESTAVYFAMGAVTASWLFFLAWVLAHVFTAYFPKSTFMANFRLHHWASDVGNCFIFGTLIHMR